MRRIHPLTGAESAVMVAAGALAVAFGMYSLVSVVAATLVAAGAWILKQTAALAVTWRYR